MSHYFNGGEISVRTVVLAALISLASGGAALAQSPSPRDPATTSDATARQLAATLEQLKRTLEAQQKLIEEQGRQIEQLRREIADAKVVPAITPSAAASPTPGPQAPAVAPPSRRTSELPPDVVSAGDFPGSFKVPGSDAALKIGGLVRVNWVSTSDALLVDDRFQTSAIPVAGSTESDRGGRVNVIATPSRFNFDLRTPTGVGHMRAFIEGDFAGPSNTLRLRHAYGQWRRWIYGQTWSTFSDPEAEPDGIDFEGLNAIVLFRQPQIRWSFPLAERWRMALALEDPRPDLTGADGVNQVPDFITRVRWEPQLGGHIQLAGIVRQLRGQPNESQDQIVAAGGYGVSISGRLPLKLWDSRDQFLFQHNSGRGLGRYISDLGSLGGQDGVYDPGAHSLRPLDVYSGYVGYEHWWNSTIRSSLSFGIVGVDNIGIQPGEALHLTRRSTINFMWSPIPRMDLVAEYLWGIRVNKDGRRGSAGQTQIGSTFRF